MLHAKCYVLHVTCDMFKSFIIYGETGDQELARDFFQDFEILAGFRYMVEFHSKLDPNFFAIRNPKKWKTGSKFFT